MPSSLPRHPPPRRLLPLPGLPHLHRARDPRPPHPTLSSPCPARPFVRLLALLPFARSALGGRLLARAAPATGLLLFARAMPSYLSRRPPPRRLLPLPGLPHLHRAKDPRPPHPTPPPPPLARLGCPCAPWRSSPSPATTAAYAMLSMAAGQIWVLAPRMAADGRAVELHKCAGWAWYCWGGGEGDVVSTCKLTTLRVKQSSGSYCSFFWAFNYEDPNAQGGVQLIKSMKAVSIHPLSKDKFSVLDSAGVLRVFGLPNTEMVSEATSKQYCENICTYCLDCAMKVQLFAVFPSSSTNGGHSVHIMSAFDVESPNSDNGDGDGERELPLSSQVL